MITLETRLERNELAAATDANRSEFAAEPLIYDADIFDDVITRIEIEAFAATCCCLTALDDREDASDDEQYDLLPAHGMALTPIVPSSQIDGDATRSRRSYVAGQLLSALFTAPMINVSTLAPLSGSER